MTEQQRPDERIAAIRERWAILPPDIDYLLQRCADLTAERDAAHATVSRVWKALGISTYAEAGGQEISERVAALAAQNAVLRGALESTQQQLHLILTHGLPDIKARIYAEQADTAAQEVLQSTPADTWLNRLERLTEIAQGLARSEPSSFAYRVQYDALKAELDIQRASTPADALERVRQRDALLTEMGLFLASLAGDIPTWEAMPDSFKAILEDLQRRRAALKEGSES